LGDSGADGMKILKWFLKNKMCLFKLDSSGQGQVAGSCEHSNKSSGSIKGGELLD
jgi:hypothetical protein